MPAGTGQSEPDVTEIRELEERLDNFRIQTSSDMTIRGSAWQGYALDVPICGGGQVIACCFEDASCQLLSPEQCVSSGGTITGGSCDPNPCGGGCAQCPNSPCHAIGEIHLAVEGDRYGSCSFFVDDDFFENPDACHLSINLQTIIVIRKTSDDTVCNLNDPSVVNLSINATCNPETNLWELQIVGSIGAWLCPFEDCPISDNVLFSSEIEELGTLPQDVELVISGTYTCGTVSGTSTLTISETCGTYGACNFPCPDTTTPCSQRTESGCIAIGGEWQGAGTEDCPPKTGGCYTEEGCEELTQAECIEAGGEYDADCTTCP